jgi:hypothetical protein
VSLGVEVPELYRHLFSSGGLETAEGEQAADTLAVGELEQGPGAAATMRCPRNWVSSTDLMR